MESNAHNSLVRRKSAWNRLAVAPGYRNEALRRRAQGEEMMDDFCTNLATSSARSDGADSDCPPASRRSFLKVGGGVLAMGTAQAMLPRVAIAQPAAGDPDLARLQ